MPRNKIFLYFVLPITCLILIATLVILFWQTRLLTPRKLTDTIPKEATQSAIPEPNIKVSPKAEYRNPFDEDTYINPFTAAKNPFDNLR